MKPVLFDWSRLLNARARGSLSSTRSQTSTAGKAPIKKSTPKTMYARGTSSTLCSSEDGSSTWEYMSFARVTTPSHSICTAADSPGSRTTTMTIWTWITYVLIVRSRQAPNECGYQHKCPHLREKNRRQVVFGGTKDLHAFQDGHRKNKRRFFRHSTLHHKVFKGSSKVSDSQQLLLLTLRLRFPLRLRWQGLAPRS